MKQIQHLITARPVAAVVAVKAVCTTWREVCIARRAKVLDAFRILVEEHQAEIAARLTNEHGKMLGDSAGEVTRALRTSNMRVVWPSY